MLLELAAAVRGALHRLPGRLDDDGDVPGWVLVTAMTVALILGIWAFAGPKITQIIQQALNRVNF